MRASTHERTEQPHWLEMPKTLMRILRNGIHAPQQSILVTHLARLEVIFTHGAAHDQRLALVIAAGKVEPANVVFVRVLTVRIS